MTKTRSSKKGGKNRNSDSKSFNPIKIDGAELATSDRPRDEPSPKA